MYGVLGVTAMAVACLRADWPAREFRTHNDKQAGCVFHPCHALHPHMGCIHVRPPHAQQLLSECSMNTKLSQIEKSLKLKYRLENSAGQDPHAGGVGDPPTRAPSAGGGGPAGIGGGDGGGFGHPRNRENEQLVEELHRYNGVLLRENSDLKTKIKVQACPCAMQCGETLNYLAIFPRRCWRIWMALQNGLRSFVTACVCGHQIKPTALVLFVKAASPTRESLPPNGASESDSTDRLLKKRGRSSIAVRDQRAQ